METVVDQLKILLMVTLIYQYARIFSMTGGSRNFLIKLQRSHHQRIGSSESESGEEEEQNVMPQLKSLKEAIHALEDVTFFLDYKGYADEAYETSKLVNSVARLHSLNFAWQTTINEYFN